MSGGLIYCFGDSHTFLLSEQPGFKVVGGGAHLAHSFRYEDHPVKVDIERILLEIPEQSNLMFMYGEIDCRMHIPKQFHTKVRTMEEAALGSVEGYVAALIGYAHRGHSVLLWGPHVMSKKWYLKGVDADPETRCGVTGTWKEIQRATMLFNRYAKEKCEGTPVKFATFYDLMVKRQIYSDTRWYQDYNHLNRECLPMIYKVMKEAGFPL